VLIIRLWIYIYIYYCILNTKLHYHYTICPINSLQFWGVKAFLNLVLHSVTGSSIYIVGFMFQMRVKIKETFVDKLFSLNSVQSPTLVDIGHLKTYFIVCYCYSYGPLQCGDCRSSGNGKNLIVKCKIFYRFIKEKRENLEIRF